MLVVTSGHHTLLQGSSASLCSSPCHRCSGRVTAACMGRCYSEVCAYYLGRTITGPLTATASPLLTVLVRAGRAHGTNLPPASYHLKTVWFGFTPAVSARRHTTSSYYMQSAGWWCTRRSSTRDHTPVYSVHVLCWCHVGSRPGLRMALRCQHYDAVTKLHALTENCHNGPQHKEGGQHF